ncbi:MAG: type IV pilus modification PilV family protein [Francisellaceae bacterium]
MLRRRCQHGFGLIDALIALLISVFVFVSFLGVMLSGINTAQRVESSSVMGRMLDNRLESSWMTGVLDVSSEDAIAFNLQDGRLRAKRTNPDVIESRIISVEAI